ARNAINHTDPFGLAGDDDSASAGDIRSVSDGQLKRDGIDAHAVKNDVLGRGAPVAQWNIGTDNDGNVFLVPRQKSSGEAPIGTGYKYDELPELFPSEKAKGDRRKRDRDSDDCD